jgi:hypothetical protein
VGLADRDRRALAGTVIAEPRETLIRPVIVERRETVVFVQLIGVDQASGPIGFYLGHRRCQRRLLIPVILGTGREGARGYAGACCRRRPREETRPGVRHARPGLGVLRRLVRPVSGAKAAPRLGLGLRSVLSRVGERARTGSPASALTGVPELTLTGIPALLLPRALGLVLPRALGLVLPRALGLTALGLRFWSRGPCAGRTAIQRCVRALALPSRPVLGHDPA